MTSTLHAIRERLVPQRRRPDIAVVAYCRAYGVEPPEQSDGPDDRPQR